MKILDQKRQGECLFMRVDKFNNEGTWEQAKPEGKFLIIGHSETGHHHVIDIDRSPSAQLLIDKTNEFMTRLELDEPAEVEHLRSFDTHETLKLPAGKYIVRHRREYTPEGLRRVED